MTHDHEALLALAETHLSFRSRLGHLLLLLAAFGMVIVILSLLVTEPMLPGRTTIAFLVLLLIGLAWVGYGFWVLLARKPMLAPHRVVAGWIAVGATAAFTLGAGLLALTPQMPAAYGAGGLGLGLFLVAVFLLRRAQREHLALLARRRALESRLKAG
jgi:hypothetical protein